MSPRVSHPKRWRQPRPWRGGGAQGGRHWCPRRLQTMHARLGRVRCGVCHHAAAMQLRLCSRSTLAAANAPSGWSCLDTFSIDSGCARCREIQCWSACADVLCAACLDSFVERSQWLHRWSFPWLRHHLRLYGQGNLDLRVACTTCGCLAASDAAAWPHARSGSAPNFAYVFVYVLNEDNL